MGESGIGRAMVRPILVCLLAVGCTSSGVPANGNRGYVTATNTHVVQSGASVDDASADAAFPGRSTAPACASSVRVGHCVFSSGCPNVVAPGVQSDTAGVISIDGALVPIVLRPDSSPTPYLFDRPGTQGWSGGETLAFAASGGSIPAFSGGIRAPAVPIVRAPTLDDNPPQSGLPTHTLTVDRSRDLAIAWDSPFATTLRFGLSSSATQTMSPSASMSCDFDATTKQGTVPASLLAMMPDGQGTVAVGAFNSSDVAVGDWTISLTAQTGATAPDGSAFGVPVLFR